MLDIISLEHSPGIWEFAVTLNTCMSSFHDMRLVACNRQTIYINNFKVEELIISVTIIFQKVAVLVCKVLHFLAKPTCQIWAYLKFLELVIGFSRGEPYFWRVSARSSLICLTQFLSTEWF